jgi:hypothetical protein
MRWADSRSRLHHRSSCRTRDDASTGTITLSGSLADPESLALMRQALESGLSSETHPVTVDLSDVTMLPAPALRELEVAKCLGGDMGQPLRLTATAGTDTAEVLACADVPFNPARRRPR